VVDIVVLKVTLITKHIIAIKEILLEFLDEFNDNLN